MSLVTSITQEQSKSLETFFREPEEPQIDKEILIEGKSYLFMLRQDARICLNQSEKNQEIAIWAATTIILTGIDLLGQFYTGIQSNRVGTRFIRYCEKFITYENKRNNEKATALYMLRNALVHKYGLLSIDLNTANKYEFVVTYNNPGIDLIYPLETKDEVNVRKYLVDLHILYDKFEDSVLQYKKYLIKNNDKLETFMTVFKSYGKVGQPKEIVISPTYVNYTKNKLVIDCTSASSLVK